MVATDLSQMDPGCFRHRPSFAGLDSARCFSNCCGSSLSICPALFLNKTNAAPPLSQFCHPHSTDARSAIGLCTAILALNWRPHEPLRNQQHWPCHSSNIEYVNVRPTKEPVLASIGIQQACYFGGQAAMAVSSISYSAGFLGRNFFATVCLVSALVWTGNAVMLRTQSMRLQHSRCWSEQRSYWLTSDN